MVSLGEAIELNILRCEVVGVCAANLVARHRSLKLQLDNYIAPL